MTPTPQEAIKFLKETQVGCKFTQDKQLYDTCEVSIKALEKQIPQKPVGLSVNEYKVYLGNCPSCKNLVDTVFDKHHCPCGQALDWS